MKKEKDTLKLEDLEVQYAAFCENVKSVRQNTYWRTAFHSNEEENNSKNQ